MTEYPKSKSSYLKKFYDLLEENVLQQKQPPSSTPSTPSTPSSASQSSASQSSAIPRNSDIVRQQAKQIQKEKKIKQYIHESDQYVLKNDDTQVKKYNEVLKQRRKRPSRLANITGKHSFEFIPGIKNIKTPCKKSENTGKTCLNISSIKKLAKNSVQKEDEFEFEKLLLKYILNDIPMDPKLVTILKHRAFQRYHIKQGFSIPL
jgi:hypothetical protein